MSSFDRALGWLSLREHSEHEIRRKLKQKLVPVEEHEDVIARLKASRFLDDTRFFDVRCRALLHRRQGLMRIRQDLKSKGVLWNQARFEELEFEVRGAGSSKETLQQLVEKKMRESRMKKLLAAPKSERDARRKLENALLRTLVQRGFSVGESLGAIKEWLKKNASA
jgi:regulatory protein